LFLGGERVEGRAAAAVCGRGVSGGGGGREGGRRIPIRGEC
jgi:hypothetical protein